MEVKKGKMGKGEMRKKKRADKKKIWGSKVQEKEE